MLASPRGERKEPPGCCEGLQRPGACPLSQWEQQRRGDIDPLPCHPRLREWQSRLLDCRLQFSELRRRRLLH